MTSTFEVAVLSVNENSKELVTAESMCKQAIRTALHIFQERDLSSLPRQRASVCVVPYVAQTGEVRLALLETHTDRTNVRRMEVALSGGWSPKCPWLFKR